MKKKNNIELRDKVVLVTGAGRGLGRTIALGFAKAGAHIIINYQNSKDGAGHVKKEIEAMKRKAFMIKADVSKSG